MRKSPPKRTADSQKDSVSRRSILASLGLGGVTLFGLSSYSFTTGNTTRSTQFGVSDDETGVLGLDISQTVDRGDNNAVLFVLTNNTQDEIEVTAEITGLATTPIDFTESGTDTYTFLVASGGSKTVRVSVEQGNSDANTVPFTLTASGTNSAFNASLFRDETEIGGTADPNPGNGEVSVVNTGQKGKSGKYDIEWSTGGDTSQFSGVDLYINNQLEDAGLALSGTNTYQLNTNDTVRVELIRNDGSVEDTDEIII